MLGRSAGADTTTPVTARNTRAVAAVVRAAIIIVLYAYARIEIVLRWAQTDVAEVAHSSKTLETLRDG
jgi:hypothetical protein